jgi:hypothetical protein
MEDEEFDNLYEDILNNGLVNDNYKLKFVKIVDALKDNIGGLSDYAEIDTTEWGNCIY